MPKQDIKEIKNLININEDAVEFYKDASEQSNDPQFKTTFKSLESLHNSVVVNLQEYATLIGAETEAVEADETLQGLGMQFVGKMIADLSDKTNEALVSYLEEAEDRCLHQVQDIMEDDNITPATKSALKSEETALKKSHDYMKALKDHLSEAA